MEYIKDNWLIVFFVTCFLGATFCSIMVIYHKINLWVYKYKINNSVKIYIKQQEKLTRKEQEKLIRKKQNSERESEKEQREYYFRLENRKMILE